VQVRVDFLEEIHWKALSRDQPRSHGGLRSNDFALAPSQGDRVARTAPGPKAAIKFVAACRPTLPLPTKSAVFCYPPKRVGRTMCWTSPLGRHEAPACGAGKVSFEPKVAESRLGRVWLVQAVVAPECFKGARRPPYHPHPAPYRQPNPAATPRSNRRSLSRRSAGPWRSPGPAFSAITYCFYWRPRLDSNQRPTA
jgi:hypothetical protein